MTEDSLRYEVDQSVATITLDRPEQLNATSRTMAVAHGRRTAPARRTPVFTGRVSTDMPSSYPWWDPLPSRKSDE